jgi:hypothetical protein
MDTDTIDILFLELSQFTKARTARELELEARVERARLAAVRWREDAKNYIEGTYGYTDIIKILDGDSS